MARDGTSRGGRRVRAGRPPASLADNVSAGRESYVMELPEFPSVPLDAPDYIGDVPDVDGSDIPSPSDYLSAEQRDGKPLGADVIFTETFQWLRERECDRLVNPRLVESYSEAFARYVQCSEALSKFGLLGKHPTTGAPIASPFAQMSLNWQKQANALWYEIFDIVRQNSLTAYEGDPQGDAMEALLRSRG